MSNKKNAKNNEPTEEEKRRAELLQMKKNDPSTLKQDIFRLKQQLQQIVLNKKQLQLYIQSKSKQNIDRTSIIEDDLKKQQQKLIEVENQSIQLTNKHKEEIKTLSQKFNLEQQTSLIKKEKESKQKSEQLQKTKNQIEFLKKYPQRKQKYQSSLKQLNERIQKMRIQQQKDINNIKTQHLRQREKHEKDTQSEMKKIKQSQVSRLQEKMTTQQFIKKENEIMESEIALCEQQVQLLGKQCSQLKQQIQKQKSMNGQNTLGTQANQTYERSLRIMKLQGKLTKLKAYLGQQSNKLQKQFQDLDHSYAKQNEDIQAKISKVQGWMRIKQRDLKKVKACSQMVLNQRSNLESYLLQVFYEHPQIQYKDERNINKILRFLFAKINSKKAPITYKNFLPQSLKSLSSSSFRA